MKFFLLPILAVFHFSISFAQSVSYSWVKAFPSNATQVSDADMAMDASTIILMSFTDSIDLDPTETIQYSYPQLGPTQALVRMDSLGQLLWYKLLATSGNQGLFNLALDDHDNIYLTATYNGNLNIYDDNDTIEFINNTSRSHVLKFSISGELYADFVMIEDEFLKISDTHIDNGKFYACGYYTDTVDFDNSVGEFVINASGSTDQYLSCFDTLGVFSWVWSYSDIFFDEAISIETNSNNEILLFANIAGHSRLFKIDTFGNTMFNKLFFSSHDVIATDLEIDNDGSIYCIGNFIGNLDTDPDPDSIAILTSMSVMVADAFVLKLDSNAIFQWSKKIGWGGMDTYNSLDLFDNGDLLLMGNFQGSCDFDPGPSVAEQFGMVFYQKLNSWGDYEWAKVLVGQVSSKKVFLKNHSIYSVGRYAGNPTDYDPGPLQEFILQPTPDGVFLHKMQECSPLIVYDTIITCESFQWSDGLVYSNGVNDVIFNFCSSLENGCDSIVYAHIVVNELNNGVLQNEATLTAIEDSAIYQWINCSNFQPIDGANSADFTAPQNGNYAVVIEKFGCLDTSDCYYIDAYLNLGDGFRPVLIFSPNPLTENTIFISGTVPFEEGIMKLYNSEGILVFEKKLDVIEPLNIPKIESGLYWIKFTTENGQEYYSKILKL